MISIIVPIYNVEKYLEECLLSIQNQTYRDFECIMVNDGSTDSSPDIAQKFAESDVRFHLIHQENGGLSAARNTGTRYVQGDYITFVDSDDLLNHHFLELALEHIENVDILETDIKVLREYDTADITSEMKVTDERIYHTTEEALKGMCNNELNSGAWAKLYHRKLLAELHYPEGKINEDIPIILHLYKEGYTVKKIDTPGYFYRKGYQSITGASFSQRDFDSFDIIDMIKDDYKDREELNPYLHQIFSGHLLYKYITKMTPLMPEKRQFIQAIKHYGQTTYQPSFVLKVTLVSPTLAWICARIVINVRKVRKR